MPTYSINMHPTLPAVMTAATPEFNFEDFRAYRAEVSHLLDSLSAPVYYVMDMRNVHFDAGEIMVSTNLATRFDNPNFRHPNVRQVIFVSTSPVWQLVAEGLNHDIFGNLSVPVFETVEGALGYIESQTG